MAIITVIEKGNIVEIPKEDFEELMEFLESLMETLEILTDEEFKIQIEKSLQDIKEERIYEIKNEEDLKKLLFEE